MHNPNVILCLQWNYHRMLCRSCWSRWLTLSTAWPPARLRTYSLVRLSALSTWRERTLRCLMLRRERHPTLCEVTTSVYAVQHKYSWMFKTSEFQKKCSPFLLIKLVFNAEILSWNMSISTRNLIKSNEPKKYY